MELKIEEYLPEFVFLSMISLEDLVVEEHYVVFA